MSARPVVCFYHAPCADGFGAAWAVQRAFPNAIFVPSKYGVHPTDLAPLSQTHKNIPCYVGADVLVVDFSFPIEQLRALEEQCHSVTVIDHHKSAIEALKPYNLDQVSFYTDAEPQTVGFRSGLRVLLNLEVSGAVLTWQFLNNLARRVPELLCYVQDRDLWQFHLPHSKAISQWLFSWPYDFEVWNSLETTLSMEDGFKRAVEIGNALLAAHARDTQELIRECQRFMTIGAYIVPVVNAPHMYASDIGHILSLDSPSFAATYFDDKDGIRRFSLRSSETGVDVSKIAGLYGGGGHKHAAGFAAPTRGWEGEGKTR